MIVVKKNTLSIFIFLILTILVVSFGIYPIFKDIQKNYQTFISQKDKLASLAAQIENLNKLKITYEKLEPSLEKIDKIFVNPGLPVEFIAFLEKIAKDSKIEIKISSPPLREKDILTSLNFQINTTGFFPNFLSFFEKIETAPYLIEIQNLNVSKAGKVEAGIAANLSIKVYSR